jgi:Siphovirus Gp157
MPSNVPHGAAIERAMSAAMEAISALPDDGDNVLLLNTIEGESDVLEVLDRVVEAAIADKKLAELARERAKRIEARADRARGVALQILEALQVSPLERPLYSASISYPRKPLVTNADELPKEMIREAPDMIAIGKALRAGETIPGAELRNPEPQLTIRVS